MEQKYQVNTFEQGQEFKGLGIMAESYFVWENHQRADGWELTKRNLYNNSYPERIVPAYSRAELINMLSQIKTHRLEIYFSLSDLAIRDEARLYPLNSQNHQTYSVKTFHTDKFKLVEGDLLIYALQQKIIKPKDLKL